MASRAMQPDMFDLGFDTFIDSGDLVVAGAPIPEHAVYSPAQLKTSQPALPTNVDFNGGLFFSDFYDIPTYTPVTAELSPGQAMAAHASSSYSDSTGRDMDNDIAMGTGHDSPTELDPAEKMSPQRRYTEGSLSNAQTRRKAQNRAAQRAFRERKERHVRELETRLSALTEKATSLQCDNDRLINLLKKVQSENQTILNRPIKISRSASFSDAAMPPPLFSPTTGITSMPLPLNSSGTSTTQSFTEPSTPSTGISMTTTTAPRCLDPAATWDLLVSHPLFADGALDIGQVCSRLSSLARCEDTTGPVFDETDVRRVIEEVATGI